MIVQQVMAVTRHAGVSRAGVIPVPVATPASVAQDSLRIVDRLRAATAAAAAAAAATVGGSP